MLTLENVTVTLDAFRLDADLTIETGRKVAVLGASGAGKSTLLAAIAGFQPVTGHIAWDGNDLTPLKPADRPVTMLFQDNNLFPHLSAADNVALALSPGLRLSSADRTRVDEALAHVGLAGMGARKPAQLSELLGSRCPRCCQNVFS